MQVSVYLLPDTAEILKQFGSLTDVTNKILTACENGEIDIFNKPSVNRLECKRFNVEVYSNYYIELIDRFSVKSTKISLTRLLNWFAANEVYDALGWQARDDVTTSKVFDKAKSILCEMQTLANRLNDSDLQNILRQFTKWVIDYETRINKL